MLTPEGTEREFLNLQTRVLTPAIALWCLSGAAAPKCSLSFSLSLPVIQSCNDFRSQRTIQPYYKQCTFMAEGDRMKASGNILSGFTVSPTISSHDFLSYTSFSINLNATYCCEHTRCFPASCLCSYFPLHLGLLSPSVPVKTQFILVLLHKRVSQFPLSCPYSTFLCNSRRDFALYTVCLPFIFPGL